VDFVSAKEGLWLRDEKTVDHKTDDAYYLESASYIATPKAYETSNTNSYDWKEAVYYDGEGLQTGYVVSDYIVDADLANSNYKKFTVTLKNASSLKLRKEASTDSDIIEELENGSEVVLIPNIASISDDKYDWFYVAYKDGDEVKLGYVAATFYGENEIVHYLVSSSKDSDKVATTNTDNKLIMKEVDTSTAKYAPLKLRNQKGLDGEIISQIENGTEIYTYNYLIEEATKSKEIDGYKWLKVYLINGQSGYVAMDYVKDIVEDTKNLTDESDSISLEIANGKTDTQEGYFGIDIQNSTDFAKLEKILTSELSYDVKYSVARPEVATMTKPQFVMIKLGATYYSSSYDQAALADTNYSCLDNVKKLANLCEKYQVPYGFYYYSQATSEEDIDIEANFINYALNYLGTSDYNIMPLTIDIESRMGSSNTRVSKNASKNGRSYQTNITNKLMNRVREENSTDVILYTNHETLKKTLNYDELDSANQQNSWLVNPSSAHSIDLYKKLNSAYTNASISQIALDGTVLNSVGIDVDFIDKDYFESLFKKNDLKFAKAEKESDNQKVLALN
jgi:hypothetical protein